MNRARSMRNSAKTNVNGYDGVTPMTIDPPLTESKGPPSQDQRFFGHPRGLATLFFTEMWERFTYYGMRALLVLFLVGAIAHGGFGIDDKTATAIYGLYTAGVYLAALPGGWIADRVIGAQRAVIAGGVLITAGNAILA